MFTKQQTSIGLLDKNYMPKTMHSKYALKAKEQPYQMPLYIPANQQSSLSLAQGNNNHYTSNTFISKPNISRFTSGYIQSRFQPNMNDAITRRGDFEDRNVQRDMYLATIPKQNAIPLLPSNSMSTMKPPLSKLMIQDDEKYEEKIEESAKLFSKIREYINDIEAGLKIEQEENERQKSHFSRATELNIKLEGYLKDLTGFFDQRTSEHESLSRHHDFLMAKGLEHRTNDELENLKSSLAAGYQQATIAMAHIRHDVNKPMEKCKNFEYYSDSLPTTMFSADPCASINPQVNSITQKCNYLGLHIKQLLDIQDMKNQYFYIREKQYRVLAQTIDKKVKDYHSQKDTLGKLEEKVDNLLTNTKRLNGTAIYTNMTYEELTELNRCIQKNSNSIAVEQARRDILANSQNMMMTDMMKRNAGERLPSKVMYRNA